VGSDLSSFVIQHLLYLQLIIFCVHNHCSLPLVGWKDGYILILGQVSQGLSFPLGQVELRRVGRVKQSCYCRSMGLLLSEKFAHLLSGYILIQMNKRGTLDQEDTNVHESGCRVLPTQPHMGPGDFHVTCSIEL